MNPFRQSSPQASSLSVFREKSTILSCLLSRPSEGSEENNQTVMKSSVTSGHTNHSTSLKANKSDGSSALPCGLQCKRIKQVTIVCNNCQSVETGETGGDWRDGV